jgi:uncharacterized membrane protein YtjA (UPF0391 family)
VLAFILIAIFIAIAYKAYVIHHRVIFFITAIIAYALIFNRLSALVAVAAPKVFHSPTTLVFLISLVVFALWHWHRRKAAQPITQAQPPAAIEPPQQLACASTRRRRNQNEWVAVAPYRGRTRARTH